MYITENYRTVVINDEKKKCFYLNNLFTNL